MEFDFERFICRKAGGNPLVEPEPKLFLVFRILWFLRLLCSCGDRKNAKADHRKDESRERICRPSLLATLARAPGATPSFVRTQPELPGPSFQHASV